MTCELGRPICHRAMIRLGLISLALLLASCGGPADRGDEAPVIDPQERELGAQQHPQLLAQFGGAYSAPEARYVATLGERLAAAAGLEGQCTFTLVNSDVVNAFAVPGCYIYVTRGLMAIIGSEAELAAVLGHELGHIVADHSERQQKRSVFREVGVLAVGVLTGSERLTAVAARAAGLFSLRYSRRQEYESDDLGIRYLKAAGFDPHAAADMLASLARHERFMTASRGHDEASGIPEWARTHPNTENRIERARETARNTGVTDDELPENERRYLAELDGLLYGDDPEQGFVLGRRFAHPVMRIGFEAPPGFTLTNSPQAILIEGPDGLRGQFGGGRLGPGGLPDYVSEVLGALVGKAPADVGAAGGADGGGSGGHDGTRGAGGRRTCAGDDASTVARGAWRTASRGVAALPGRRATGPRAGGAAPRSRRPGRAARAAAWLPPAAPRAARGRTRDGRRSPRPRRASPSTRRRRGSRAGS